MTGVLVTIRLEDGQTEEYNIDYLPMLEAAYAANYGGRTTDSRRERRGRRTVDTLARRPGSTLPTRRSR